MKKIKNFSIYLIGVGGQGIGLLSETLIRAADYADYPVRGVDTHGLAQRGGTVVSQIRIGEGVHTPLIKKSCADMVVSLERNEALRGVNTHLKDGGVLIFYDAQWQHLPVRMGHAKELKTDTIFKECELRKIEAVRVFKDDLEDSRMQNVVILAEISKRKLIPGVDKKHYLSALKDLLTGPVLETNLKIFEAITG